MSWWNVAIPGGFIAIGWVLTGRAILSLSRQITALKERISFLEAKVNGMKERGE
jgi:hypothetical protein